MKDKETCKEDIKTHFRTCNLCEAMCGLEIKYQHKKVLSIRGDKKDVLSKGHICPKAVALQDLYEDPDRLKKPIKKTDKGWVEISWEDAFSEVISNLKRVRETYGRDAIGSYRGNPTVHNIGLMLFGGPFLRAIGSTQKYTATSVDQLPHHFASLMMFGHYLLTPIPDIDRTDFMLIMGANPAVSNGSIMSAPGFSKRLKNIKKGGGKVVVIDPRFTETARIANQHFFITPGRDALLLLALLHVIFEENLADPGHLQAHINGWDELRKITTPYAPEKVEKLVSISADNIRQLARDFSNAPSAVCYGRIGLSTQEFGGLCQWLVNALNCVTANMDSIGGALFTLPAIDVLGMGAASGKRGTFNTRKTRVRGLPEFTGEFPVAALAEEILVEGEGQIRAMITIAGNPILSTPDGKGLEKAFQNLDYMVAIDIYLNETTRHADIILPTTTGLETPLYDLVFHQFSVKNTTKYCDPLFEKEAYQRHDWEVLKALSEGLSGKSNDMDLEKMLSMMLQFSPYRDHTLSLDKLREHPHGIDLGELKPQFPERLFTEDKKIELAHPLFLKDLDRLNLRMQTWKTPDREYPFRLIGRRQLRSNNSWMHNSARLIKGANRCVAHLHPDDATRLGIDNESRIEVQSCLASLEIEVFITDTIMPGVVSIPHGWGHRHKDMKMQIAMEHPGVCVNDLIPTDALDSLTSNANLVATPVNIRKRSQ